MDDVHRGHFGVVEDPATPLTAEEVEALPEGTPVVIIWSGGNGPHRYRITVDDYGRRYADAYGEGIGEQFRWYNPLRFVGQERFHTRVWLGQD
jgi:molybdopterin biosynthesis enzyme MoaB